jgi:hypothetical protein
MLDSEERFQRSNSDILIWSESNPVNFTYYMGIAKKRLLFHIASFCMYYASKKTINGIQIPIPLQFAVDFHHTSLASSRAKGNWRRIWASLWFVTPLLELSEVL